MLNRVHTAAAQALLYKSKIEVSKEFGINLNGECCEDMRLAEMKDIIDKYRENS